MASGVSALNTAAAIPLDELAAMSKAQLVQCATVLHAALASANKARFAHQRELESLLSQRAGEPGPERAFLSDVEGRAAALETALREARETVARIAGENGDLKRIMSRANSLLLDEMASAVASAPSAPPARAAGADPRALAVERRAPAIEQLPEPVVPPQPSPAAEQPRASPSATTTPPTPRAAGAAAAPEPSSTTAATTEAAASTPTPAATVTPPRVLAPATGKTRAHVTIRIAASPQSAQEPAPSPQAPATAPPSRETAPAETQPPPLVALVAPLSPTAAPAATPVSSQELPAAAPELPAAAPPVTATAPTAPAATAPAAVPAPDVPVVRLLAVRCAALDDDLRRARVELAEQGRLLRLRVPPDVHLLRKMNETMVRQTESDRAVIVGLRRQLAGAQAHADKLARDYAAERADPERLAARSDRDEDAAMLQLFDRPPQAIVARLRAASVAAAVAGGGSGSTPRRDGKPLIGSGVRAENSTLGGTLSSADGTLRETLFVDAAAQTDAVPAPRLIEVVRQREDELRQVRLDAHETAERAARVNQELRDARRECEELRADSRRMRELVSEMQNQLKIERQQKVGQRAVDAAMVAAAANTNGPAGSAVLGRADRARPASGLGSIEAFSGAASFNGGVGASSGAGSAAAARRRSVFSDVPRTESFVG
jgi:hypothetical protein